MNKVKFVKKAVTFVIGAGVTAIFKGIAENNTAPEHLYQRGEIRVATYVLGAMIGEMTSEYTDEKIDKVIALYDKMFKQEPTP